MYYLHVCILSYVLFLDCDLLLPICCGLTPTQTMAQHPMPPLEMVTWTTWDFTDRDRISAWSLDPAACTSCYHGQVVITTYLDTLQIHQSTVWQIPPFPVLIHILGAPWYTPVDPQSGTQTSSVGSTAPFGGLGTTTQGGFEVGGPSVPMETLEEAMHRAAAAAGLGPSGGPEVPHMVSPSEVSLGEDSCYEIPAPSVTPTMWIDLVTTESGDDTSTEVYEATSRVRAPSESSCLVCGEHPCVCPL